jgi:hypothetical protein
MVGQMIRLTREGLLASICGAHVVAAHDSSADRGMSMTSKPSSCNDGGSPRMKSGPKIVCPKEWSKRA